MDYFVRKVLEPGTYEALVIRDHITSASIDSRYAFIKGNYVDPS